jgi:hypothetical protein
MRFERMEVNDRKSYERVASRLGVDDMRHIRETESKFAWKEGVGLTHAENGFSTTTFQG